jgi:large subunit ribosomal protein L23
MTTIYDVLRRPIVTEKSNFQNANLHQYTFEVTMSATKGLVRMRLKPSSMSMLFGSI